MPQKTQKEQIMELMKRNKGLEEALEKTRTAKDEEIARLQEENWGIINERGELRLEIEKLKAEKNVLDGKLQELKEQISNFQKWTSSLIIDVITEYR